MKKEDRIFFKARKEKKNRMIRELEAMNKKSRKNQAGRYNQVNEWE